LVIVDFFCRIPQILEFRCPVVVSKPASSANQTGDFLLHSGELPSKNYTSTLNLQRSIIAMIAL